MIVYRPRMNNYLGTFTRAEGKMPGGYRRCRVGREAEDRSWELEPDMLFPKATKAKTPGSKKAQMRDDIKGAHLFVEVKLDSDT